jgi:polar amino acid transport system substrate-binding protein
MNRACLFRLLLPALAAALLHAPAFAGCSRPITVPAASTGHTVTFVNGQAGGMVPELLATIGARAGCTLVWSQVPRMRLEAMFESGSADLMVAATQVARRDRHGLFVPIVEARASLISLSGQRAPISTIAELLKRSEIRVAVVRGYDYGDAYQDLLKALAKQGRLFTEATPTGVARLINASMADVTIMPPASFTAGLEGDARIEGMAGKLRIEPLDELQWIRTGIYLSKSSLAAQDRKLLEDALTASVKTGLWWEGLKRYYSPAMLSQHVRPLPSTRGP